MHRRHDGYEPPTLLLSYTASNGAPRSARTFVSGSSGGRSSYLSYRGIEWSPRLELHQYGLSATAFSTLRVYFFTTRGCLVRPEGFAPPHLSVHGFEPCASAVPPWTQILWQLRRPPPVLSARQMTGALGWSRTNNQRFRRPLPVRLARAKVERMMGLEPMGSTLATLRNGRYATPALFGCSPA